MPSRILCFGLPRRQNAVDVPKIVTHDPLSRTVTFDHAVVDGAPAARVVQRLKELVGGPTG